VPGREILYTYLSSAYKVLLRSPTEVRGTKKLNFVDQCNKYVTSKISCVSKSTFRWLQFFHTGINGGKDTKNERDFLNRHHNHK